MGEGMIYTVKDIQEDPDYGCEERMEGTPLMVEGLISPPGSFAPI